MLVIKLRKDYLLIGIAVFAVIFFASAVMIARANSISDIIYPVSKLGGCKDKEACIAYCDDSDHAEECFDFAEKYKLTSDDKIAERKKFLEILKKGGPGGCKNEISCRAYCENLNHMPECVDFVEKYDLVSKDELKKMKQVASAIRQGVKPPGNCKDEKTCVSYCKDLSHYRECIPFAEAAGFIDSNEANEAKKFVPLILAGKTPGRCENKKDCLAYCKLPENTVECLEFALDNDLIEDEKERATAEKVLPALRTGTTPGNCRSKAECETYCDKDAHFKECLDFAEQAGFVSKEEAEIARKVGGKGPGGCKSKGACETYCKKQENRTECLQFGVKLGLITQAEADQAADPGNFSSCLEVAGKEIEACFISNLGSEVFGQLKSGVIPFDFNIAEKMKKAQACADKHKSAASAQIDAVVAKFPNVTACVEKDLGAGFLQRLKTGTIACGQIKGAVQKMTACFEDAFFEELGACVSQDCSGFTSCMSSIQSKLPSGTAEDKSKEVKFPQSIQDKMNSCGMNIFGMEACLDKPTCKEVLSCSSALPKQPEGAKKLDPPAKIKTKLDECSAVVAKEQYLSCVPLSCKEFNACMKSIQKSGEVQPAGGKEKIDLPKEVKDKQDKCSAEEQIEKWRACLSKSCNEFLDCVGYKEGGGGQTGSGGKQVSMPADVNTKLKYCVNEKNVTKQLACFDGRTCEQALACLGGGGGKKGGGGGDLDPRVNAKMQACMPKQPQKGKK